MAEEDNNMSLELDENENEDDAAIRAQANLNSPKGQAVAFNGDETDQNGMSLNLNAMDDEEDEYQNNPTPNTKRDQMDVNSPRAQNKQNWDKEDNSGNNAALAGLVTQVDRDDANKQSGVQSLVTQVRPDDETERNIQKQQRQAAQSGGFCSMFSCLMCCCSGPKQPEPVQMTATSNGTSTTQQTVDGNAGSQTTKSKQNETATSKLLDANGNRENKDAEDSLSSTIYEGALLPPPKPEHVGKKCLVLDLDETLVHSSFKPISDPDFVIPVEIDRVIHHVYVLKRPYVDDFLLRASKHYEIVVFTASLSKYADPLLDKLDIHNVIAHRLFRESCVIHGTAYVKDMRRIGRKLKDSIIVDNSPPSYLFQPTNAVPIASWFDDPTDTQLLDFCPVIETTMAQIDDVRKLLDANNKSFRWLCQQAHQPLSKYTVRNDLVNRQ